MNPPKTGKITTESYTQQNSSMGMNLGRSGAAGRYNHYSKEDNWPQEIQIINSQGPTGTNEQKEERDQHQCPPDQ
jgi:hypothetical protein